jgi:hypothetical protein
MSQNSSAGLDKVFCFGKIRGDYGKDKNDFI